MANHYWGVDLGGTKIECAVLSYANNECVVRERIPTEGNKGYQHVLQQIKRLVVRCESLVGERPEAIGFGTPGTLDPISQTMKNCNSTHLNGQPLHHDLEAVLNVPVRLANDANCFALAEAHLGVAAKLEHQPEVVFGIIMGTGVGSGVVVNGKALYGCHGIAGEWGHNVIEPEGRACYCGKHGCVETVLSGKGLEAYYSEISGEIRSLPVIVDLASNGDQHAVATIERLHQQFGRAVANIINVLDPDVIVVGGGVGNIDSLYTAGREAILPHLFNPVLNTQILKPELGDSAGVFGAAMLVK
ncbi:sugar kinase [Photobacterium sanctipauli]|uniref:Sugar kinase n=2 Tax=Photobacterium sanctipauli TaxID=1342794 RepID=A0A2T3NUT1_9GAMM|nr:ROK family protein [Photobacterium sanctipauli]PSW19998.1 sugar kinase [Photobacterium sanctipauli]